MLSDAVFHLKYNWAYSAWELYISADLASPSNLDISSIDYNCGIVALCNLYVTIKPKRKTYSKPRLLEAC